MTYLNRIASNWSRPERERLNDNWTIIENYLSSLQGQINLLTGDINVQELIDQINNILEQGNVIISDLQTALQDASTVIADAQNATTDANNAAQNALNAINDMQAFINQFGNAESYDNSKLYKVNNIVEFDGSGYICIQDTQGNTPPLLPAKRNDWWQLFAQRGLDGTGSVSKVAGRSPEADGNVPLTAQDVGATSGTEFAEHTAKNVADGVHGMGSAAAQTFESGLWTPTIVGATLSTQSGNYTRIGNKVFISAMINMTSKGTEANVNIKGLPFTKSANTPLETLTITMDGLITPSDTYGLLAAGSSTIGVYKLNNDSLTSGTAVLKMSEIRDALTILIKGFYTI
ncbi:hypothetical protein ACULLL_01750 [Lysinibacillus irui]|uniref:hypothetical protein n=1 Tax=Lysinibacillus irui TaxID=2998077 RepID=UPI00404470B2